MATYKLTVVFADINANTFSETHYIEASTAAQAAYPGGGVFTNRAAILHPLVTLVKVRAANVDGSRDTALKTYNFKGTSTFQDTTFGIEPASYAVVYTLAGAQGGSRRWWIRGVSSGATSRSSVNGQDKLDASFQNAITEFINSAAQKGLGIRRLTPTPNTPQNFVPIVSIAADASGQRSVLTLAQSPGWPVPSRAIVYGVNQKDFNSLSGTFQVLNVSNALVTINYKLPPYTTVPTIKGTMRLAAYNAVSVYTLTGSGLHHLGDHQTRGPLFGTRGARRAARLRTRP